MTTFLSDLDFIKILRTKEDKIWYVLDMQEPSYDMHISKDGVIVRWVWCWSVRSRWYHVPEWIARKLGVSRTTYVTLHVNADETTFVAYNDAAPVYAKFGSEGVIFHGDYATRFIECTRWLKRKMRGKKVIR